MLADFKSSKKVFVFFNRQSAAQFPVRTGLKYQLMKFSAIHCKSHVDGNCHKAAQGRGVLKEGVAAKTRSRVKGPRALR